MDSPDPVVLLSGNIWHIVAHSRRSDAALCGRRLADRRAHTRLARAGPENVCPDCLALWQSGATKA